MPKTKLTWTNYGGKGRDAVYYCEDFKITYRAGWCLFKGEDIFGVFPKGVRAAKDFAKKFKEEKTRNALLAAQREGASDYDLQEATGEKKAPAMNQNVMDLVEAHRQTPGMALALLQSWQVGFHTRKSNAMLAEAQRFTNV